MKIQIVSGSPRQGNSEYIAKKIFENINADKELILLREKNIKYCDGCDKCANSTCRINDDMVEIYPMMEKADLFVFVTPNYFENVSGLMKVFIDRTNYFYFNQKLKGKKIINIIIGGQGKKSAKKAIKNAWQCVIFSHKLIPLADFFFKAEGMSDVEKSAAGNQQIVEIVKLINGLE